MNALSGKWNIPTKKFIIIKNYNIKLVTAISFYKFTRTCPKKWPFAKDLKYRTAFIFNNGAEQDIFEPL